MWDNKIVNLDGSSSIPNKISVAILIKVSNFDALKLTFVHVIVSFKVYG